MKDLRDRPRLAFVVAHPHGELFSLALVRGVCEKHAILREVFLVGEANQTSLDRGLGQALIELDGDGSIYMNMRSRQEKRMRAFAYSRKSSAVCM